MRLAALLVGLLLAGGVLWLAGERHRESCERAGRIGCSVLPWDNGERAKLTEIQCVRVAVAIDQGSRSGPLPPECR